ncbi:MAG: DUF3006 domain-containing protein [Proteobacteria bacterium]|nr:DUF3006 domain-containing protein [Pseudomonadota bacterium]
MSHPQIVIDRIEGDMAVVEIGGIQVDWPVSYLPEGAREGQAFTLTLTPVEQDPCEPAPPETVMDIQL